MTEESSEDNHVPTMPPSRPDVPSPPRPPAELDETTRARVADAIARAIAAELGPVRISSIPPSEAPRSSMRAAAQGAATGVKWSVLASGALSLAGSVIVWLMRPEYAAPLAQALKLIAGVIVAAGGGGEPARDVAPARDVPALVVPAPHVGAHPALVRDAGP